MYVSLLITRTVLPTPPPAPPRVVPGGHEEGFLPHLLKPPLTSYGQRSPGQMLLGQMSHWLSESVLDVPKKLPLKFHQNQVRNSWDIPDMGECARTNVAWTAVTVTVGILDVPSSLHLKFGQNWVSNSWDIPHMNKCRQHKCCLDKF